MAYDIIPYHGLYNRSQRSQDVRYIVIHNTGGTGSALNNCQYFSGGNRNASAHYFVDDASIYEYADPRQWYTWHCGDGHGAYGITNGNSIGIEVVSNDELFTEAEIDRLAYLVQRLMADFDIPAERVVRHYDASLKQCPYMYVDQARWDDLHARITTASSHRSAEVWLYTPNNTPAQKWRVTWDGEYVSLVSASCGLALDVMGGGSDIGAGVWAYTPNGTDAQKWRVVRRDMGYQPESANPVELVPKVNEKLRLDCIGAGKTPGTGLQLYQENATPAQFWQLLDQGDGTWVIVNTNSSLAIDVRNGGN